MNSNSKMPGQQTNSPKPEMVTVVVCTFNRSNLLHKALQSIAQSSMPESLRWEVLIVDNNSTDQTREVFNEFCGKYPGRFRYVFEPRPGLSQARNAGVREARGSILAFTDDDVSVEPEWLHNLTSILIDSSWSGSGGRVLPEHTFSPPPWLALDGPRSLLGALCCYRDPGDTGGEFKEPPYGANMAFRREMFDKYGLFRTDLGHGPNNKVGFEDLEFGHRLMAGGQRLAYVPSAIVYHYVDESRARKDYFLTWWFDFGQGHVRESRMNLGFWRSLKILARTVGSTLLWLPSFNPQRRFYRKCRVWYGAGRIVEIYRLTANLSPPLAQSETSGVGRG